jgi:ABC-2 type transport system permease protein
MADVLTTPGPATPSPAVLARHMIGMRLAIMRNSLRGDKATNLYTGVSVGVILALATVAVAVLWPAQLPLVLAVWLSGWVFGPIFIGGGSEALRPEYFSMLPARPAPIATALLAGAFAGPAPLVSLIALMSLPVYGWRFGPAGVLIGLVAALATLVTLVMISRVIVALIGLFVRSRATAAAAGVVTGTAIALCSNGWAPAVALGGADTATWSHVMLRALPSGWGVAAVEAPWALGLAILAADIGMIVPLLAAWAALLSRRVVSAARGGVPPRRGTPRPLPATSGARIVAAKELRAWWRDLVRIQLLAIAFTFAVVTPLLLVTIGAWVLVPFTGLIAIVMAAASAANLYGSDGTALWLTLMTPGAERLDVRGRQLAWLLVVAPAAVVLSIGGALVSGLDWAWPWVLGLLPALLGGGAGVIVLLGVTSLVPGTDPHKRGGNPLSTGADETAETGLAWVVLMAVPSIALPTAGAILLDPWAGVVTGVLTGILCYWGFGRIAYRRLESRGIELLNLMKHGPAPEPDKPTTADLPLGHRIGVTACHLIAWLPLFPQGLVPLVMKILGIDNPSWFLALHLPPAWQWPTIIFMIAVGLLMYGYAILLPMRLSSSSSADAKASG